MAVSGTVEDHGERIPVTGLAWFDKQWGNFLVMGGGWDWFCLQLDDGSDVMLNLIRNGNGVTTSRTARMSRRTDRSAICPATSSRSRSWVSGPARRQASPTQAAGGSRCVIRTWTCQITPVIQDQELDTRQSTSLVYWEGAQTVAGTRGGQPVAGQGYVELVGYGN